MDFGPAEVLLIVALALFIYSATCLANMAQEMRRTVADLENELREEAQQSSGSRYGEAED